MWETVIICSLFFCFNFLSLIIGLHYGSKTKNNERIDIPSLNPVKAVKKKIKEDKEEKAKEKEQLIEEINLYNIENYDGKGIGQKDFPR